MVYVGIPTNSSSLSRHIWHVTQTLCFLWTSWLVTLLLTAELRRVVATCDKVTEVSQLCLYPLYNIHQGHLPSWHELHSTSYCCTFWLFVLFLLIALCKLGLHVYYLYSYYLFIVFWVVCTAFFSFYAAPELPWEECKQYLNNWTDICWWGWTNG